MTTASGCGCQFGLKPRDELFCPAWMVPTVENEDEATMDVAWEKTEIKVNKVSISVNLPYLTPKANYIGNKVALCRPTADSDCHQKKRGKGQKRLWTLFRSFAEGMGFPMEEAQKKTKKDVSLKHLLG